MHELQNQPAGIPALKDQRANSLDRISVFGPPPLIPGEDVAAYEHLHARIAGAVKPKDFLEEIWVRDVVDLSWDCLRLRRIAAQLAADHTADSIKSRLQKVIGAEKAQELSRRWARHEDEAIKQVAEHLASLGESVENVVALTFDHPKHMRTFAQVAHFTASAETRRNAAVREIDRDRGEPRGSAPPTPPYIRVRIRRFEKLG